MTRPFAVLWLGGFAFFLSFLLLLSALPLFARRMGASDGAIGVIMAAFAITSLVLRPVTGWGADRYGRRPFMLAGAVVFTLASIAYGWAAGALSLVLVRLVHGAGMGLYPTAASAMVVDVTPIERRGAALGLYGVRGSLALAVGPISGIALVNRAGFTALFWTAGAVAALSVVTTLLIPETLARPRVNSLHTGEHAQPRGAVALTDHALHDVHLRRPGRVPAAARRHPGREPRLFFVAFAVMIALTRGPAGRLSDRVGRAPVAATGLLLAAAALLALTFSETARGLTAAGAVYGVAYGATQPALMAWCVDDVSEHDRGRAMATFYSALEIGIAIGAMSSGLAVVRWGFTTTFVATAGIAATGAALTLLRR